MTHARRLASSAFLSLLLCAACSDERGRGANGPGDAGGADAMPGQMTQVVLAPGTPSNAPDQFAAPANPAAAPEVVYPPDGVLLPPNLSELEVQWKPAPSTHVFELRFVSTYLDLTIYTTCAPVGEGCGFTPDEPTWQLLSQQARGDRLTLTVRATGGSGVGSAAPRTLSFTDEDLLGGLYYWAAAAGQIVRYDFGKRGQTAEAFYGAAEAGATCVGCHALARNGERIAVGLNAPVPTAGLRVLEIASKMLRFDRGGAFGGGSNFEAFSPDGSRILVNDGADLLLLDGATGAQIGGAPAIAGANLPDWSADGSRVAFARAAASSCPLPGLCDSIPGVTGADLYTAEVSGDSFGVAKLIVSGGGNNFYPTFSPDGSLVAFNRSASNASSFDAPDARVWLVGSNGGTPLLLQQAAAPTPNVGDSWPKFAPYSHHFRGETIFWLTFSSRRDYGLRLINSDKVPSGDEDPRTAQIWMVAVPKSALEASSVPAGGYPAFWLPFQAIHSGNHIAQWTEKIVRQPCSNIDGNPCPNGEVCENGECVGAPIL